MSYIKVPATIYLIVKAVAMGLVASVVLTATISPFAQALIIATVSASIGAIGVIGAAYITYRAERRRTDDALNDLKRASGLTRRRSDPATEDEEC